MDEIDQLLRESRQARADVDNEIKLLIQQEADLNQRLNYVRSLIKALEESKKLLG